MTRRRHRCRTRKDRPVSSRTATVSSHHAPWQRVGGEISRPPTDRRTVPRSSRQIVPSLAFRRFLPSARGLRGWILPSFGLGPPAPRHEQREPERLYLEVPIYSASVSEEVTREMHRSKGHEPCYSSSRQRQWLRSPWKDFPCVLQLELVIQGTTQS